MDLSGFRDPAIARGVIDALNAIPLDRTYNIMEVCGTHT
ncbi:MAG: hydrogenase formation protein HypD, partial [Actinobacteria bacterium]